MDDELSIVYGCLGVWRSVLYLWELELCLNVSAAVCVCVCVCSHILWGSYALVNLDLHGCVLRVCMCACVCLIALVTQAVSHSHCSKLWVGEGHCGADRGDRKERGDGGWIGEKETEDDDNEKLKAVRKWDVGLHSRAIVFTAKKYVSPWELKLFLPPWGESI